MKLEELERQVDLETRIPSNVGRTGLGFYRTLKVKDAKDKRSQILTALKDEAEHKRLVILHGYEMQNGWMKWGLDGVMTADLTWKSLIYRYSEQLTSLF